MTLVAPAQVQSLSYLAWPLNGKTFRQSEMGPTALAHVRRLLLFLLSVLVIGVGVGCADRSSASTTQRQETCAGHNQARLPEHWRGRSAQRIVFVDECVPGGFGALYSIGLDGTGLKRLGAGGSNPAVSPDGTEIAFGDDNGMGIAVIRADGRPVRHVSHGLLDGSPAWSPDGRKLVYVGTISPAPNGALFASTLYVVNADGTGRRKLAPSAVDFPGPSWINKRQILITAGRSELAIISATTGRTDRLIPLPRVGTQAASDTPALAPNRREIAYVECDSADCDSTSVDLITLAGKLIKRIQGAHTPTWTPQGNLLYACCEQAGLLGDTSEIVMAPAQHGEPRAITPDSFSADDPQWLGAR
jgi:Tol biopolymer transport system component